MKTTNLIGQTI